MLQLHLSDHQFNCPLKCVLYKRLDSIYIIFKWISCEITLIWMSLNFTDKQWNIGSGNGLVPSGNKPLPESMLTQISATYGITRPQWVNPCCVVFILGICKKKNICIFHNFSQLRWCITHWPKALGDLNKILDKQFSRSFYKLMFEISLVKLPSEMLTYQHSPVTFIWASDKCHRAVLISQQWFR